VTHHDVNASGAPSSTAPSAPAPRLSVQVRHTLARFVLDVAFDIGAGITALVGPSGSGKTLTLRAIAGLLHPEVGRIALNGRLLLDTAAGHEIPARDRAIGYVFQQYALFPHLTVGENVGYGLWQLARAEREARVHGLLGQVGLEQFADRRPRTLSGGQQQRVALARALAPQPAALLLDEPLAALDAPLRQRLGEELRELGDSLGLPMLLVTHDPEEAARIAHRIVSLENGRVDLAAG
jgi:molybdate transport system ATP-binding protein